MPKNLYKILAILSFIFLLTGLGFYFTPKPPKNLEVDFLDVGQGDSILIRAPGGQNVLVDGGPDKKVLKRLGENLGWLDRRIDLMILTHPHDDHVSGLDEVVKNYRVDKILYTGVLHNSPGYLDWLKTVKEKRVPMTIIQTGFKIDLGEGLNLEILSPEENLLNKEVENLNNSSVVLKMRYKDTSFLLVGDAEKETEEKLLTKDIRADVLKIGHHGSDTSSTEDFLKKVAPQIAVISVGKNNQFGHPHQNVLKRLERLGIRVYRTDLDGTARIMSDGKTAKLSHPGLLDFFRK